MFAMAFGNPFFRKKDEKAKSVRLNYEMDSKYKSQYEKFSKAFDRLENCSETSLVLGHIKHSDWKSSGGSDTKVEQKELIIEGKLPEFYKSNVTPKHLDLDGLQLYLFPDRALVFTEGGLFSLEYSELKWKSGTSIFVSENPPEDAKLIGYTWKYVNKDGSPDGRFKGNYEIPKVMYGLLKLELPGKPSFFINCSSPTAAELLVGEVSHYR